MSGEYNVNTDRTAIEVKFPSRPSTAFRSVLKGVGFKWQSSERLWRAAYTSERLEAAQSVAEPGRAVQQDDRPTRFEFGEGVDAEQKRAILHGDGPLLVVAGPGAGKTSTMVKRIAFLVLERGVAPEQIMVATFSRKAAKELLTRVSNEFAGLERPVNVDKMRIGTFHSICQRILSEYGDVAGLRNFSVIEEFDQKFLVWYGREFKALRKAKIFRTSQGKELGSGSAKYADRFVECANTLAEERVPLEALAASGAERASELARYIGEYRQALESAGKLDYADLQVRTIELLETHPEVLADLRSQIRYIIVDEYQDTNFIQEQLVLLLAGDERNVCVVGDDDQSLYRFRGATVQNILEFESHFGGECARCNLVTNYRSQAGIVDFCRRWMLAEEGHKGDPTWGGCRHDKAIQPNPGFDPAIANPVSVVSCAAGSVSSWCDRMLELVRDLQKSPDFVDLNQVAFICGSVKSDKVRALIRHFECNGIPVNAPRAKMFFERDEVRIAIGCLISCFPSCDGMDRFSNCRKKDLLGDCRKAAEAAMASQPDLAAWVRGKRELHSPDAIPSEGLGYAFSGLFSEMLQYQPFRGWLDQSDSMGLADAARSRNMSKFAQVCSRFEMNEGYHAFRAHNVESKPLWFFDKYLGGLADQDGIDEYEDESEYAPSGCVSFMTVHQAKGMEFPVVVVCSLQDEPWGSEEPEVEVIRSLNGVRRELEAPEDRAGFDFWRKYYTAFSRAQDLLVLASAGKVPTKNDKMLEDPSPCFADLCAGLPDASELDYGRLHLRTVKPVNIMRTYSFTSDVAAYRACSRRYKLMHELHFPAAAGQGMLFGALVHQCVEDIHRIVKRMRDAGEDTSRLFIPREQIEAIVHANRMALERMEGASLKSREREAFKQVMKYLKYSKDIWRDVVEPEVAVSEVRDGFVLKGVIDLVHGDDDCVEVVDFKTGKVPPEGSRLLEKYKRQMLVYVHLVRTQLGREVSGAKLYFTSDKADRPVIDVPATEEDVAEILREFDETVKRIEARECTATSDDAEECKGCPFACYCGRVGNYKACK